MVLEAEVVAGAEVIMVDLGVALLVEKQTHELLLLSKIQDSSPH